ncbi:hypothetical protein MMC25_007371 [Agyrium rufum]|nr:hypothetical protein [Agyrium rufum]
MATTVENHPTTPAGPAVGEVVYPSLRRHNIPIYHQTEMCKGDNVQPENPGFYENAGSEHSKEGDPMDVDTDEDIERTDIAANIDEYDRADIAANIDEYDVFFVNSVPNIRMKAQMAEWRGASDELKEIYASDTVTGAMQRLWTDPKDTEALSRIAKKQGEIDKICEREKTVNPEAFRIPLDDIKHQYGILAPNVHKYHEMHDSGKRVKIRNDICQHASTFWANMAFRSILVDKYVPQYAIQSLHDIVDMSLVMSLVENRFAVYRNGLDGFFQSFPKAKIQHDLWKKSLDNPGGITVSKLLGLPRASDEGANSSPRAIEQGSDGQGQGLLRGTRGTNNLAANQKQITRGAIKVPKTQAAIGSLKRKAITSGSSLSTDRQIELHNRSISITEKQTDAVDAVNPAYDD